MAKPLKDLTDKLPTSVKEAATAKANALLKEMTLAELRRSKKITQDNLALVCGMKQPSIAQLEKREDIYISTLRNYLHALGGQLEICARFPDGTIIRIKQFS